MGPVWLKKVLISMDIDGSIWLCIYSYRFMYYGCWVYFGFMRVSIVFVSICKLSIMDIFSASCFKWYALSYSLLNLWNSFIFCIVWLSLSFICHG